MGGGLPPSPSPTPTPHVPVPHPPHPRHPPTPTHTHTTTHTHAQRTSRRCCQGASRRSTPGLAARPGGPALPAPVHACTEGRGVEGCVGGWGECGWGQGVPTRPCASAPDRAHWVQAALHASPCPNKHTREHACLGRGCTCAPQVQHHQRLDPGVCHSHTLHHLPVSQGWVGGVAWRGWVRWVDSVCGWVGEEGMSHSPALLDPCSLAPPAPLPPLPSAHPHPPTHPT